LRRRKPKVLTGAWLRPWWARQGCRIGEVKAQRWREDVDMIPRPITVNQQTRSKQTTTPKARTRRTTR
jgi:hypothetical protein